jgi:acyl-CoA synthetase (NDP forming)
LLLSGYHAIKTSKETGETMNIIEKALERGAATLSEYESKLFLAHHGIPVTRETTVESENDAVTAATEIGYPVALKGSGDQLSHKTELGLIELDVRNEQDVRAAFRRLTTHPTAGVKEVLVQQMIKGERELVIGLTRDPQFGPCVMFGLGGIFTEILGDITFRVAPLSRQDAMEMMDEIRGNKILNAVRGKPPVDLQALSDILIAVGEIGLAHNAIKEIDLNPIKIQGDKPVAVDALIVLEHETS